MNAAELAANPQLDRWFVGDLNDNPTFPELDGSFEAVLVCVGVQYLQPPLAVFRQMRRILQPGGTAIVSFSNRCLPTKAVAVWRALDDKGHAALVRLCFEKAGLHGIEVAVLRDGRSSDPLVAVTAFA